MSQNSLVIGVVGGLAALAIAGVGFAVLRADGPATETAGVERVETPSVEPARPPARFTRAAETSDPNGFSNVRGGPTIEHPIVGRVEQGETFTTYPQTGEWWEVRTADGTVGYMSSAYIRMLGGAAPVAAVAEPPASPSAGPDKPATVEVAAAPRPAPVSMAGQVFPDSGVRRLTRADLSGLNRTQLRLARNEIYARRGRWFQDPALRRHFEQFPWYRPVRAEVGLNRVETYNVALLQAAEAGK